MVEGEELRRETQKRDEEMDEEDERGCRMTEMNEGGGRGRWTKEVDKKVGDGDNPGGGERRRLIRERNKGDRRRR